MLRRHRRFFRSPLMLFVSLLAACSDDTREKKLFEIVPPSESGILFNNLLSETEHLNILTFEYFFNGAGVGVGDINNDGLKDLLFSGNMVDNRLYLNKGNLVFEDITAGSGLISAGKWATGVSMVDVNHDGWLDIYLCYAGPFSDPNKRQNELYINNGDKTFSERAREYGLNDTGHTVQAAFFDYDRDEDLDVYLLTNITDETGPNVIRRKKINGEMQNTDRLYRNDGGFFTNVSTEAGITIEGYGLGVAITDLNHDDWPDIYVSNDYLSNDILYINNGNGKFTDKAAEYFKHTSYSAMGNDVADFNNDGLADIIAVDMLPPDNKRQKLMFGSTNYDRYRSEIQYGYTPQFMRNTLQLNLGFPNDSTMLFSEIGQLAGVAATDWSWSALLADFDNDGWKDLFVTNGYPKDITNRDFASYKANEIMRSGYGQSSMKKLGEALKSLEGAYRAPFAFRNNANLTFSDVTPDWGFSVPSYSTGAAYGDLDNDGDLDLVVNNTNSHAVVYKNNANENQKHYLRISLRESDNKSCFGAKVWVYHDGNMQYFENSPYRGFQSSVDPDIHVGLGGSTHADSIVIQWTDGTSEKLLHIAADRVLNIEASKKTKARRQVPKQSAPCFIPSEEKFEISFKHEETHYVDFKIQPLLPHKNSQEGPGIAVGDVNGDGREDFFVGGAYNQSGAFFIRRKDGKFNRKELVTKTKYEEDMGCLLFDSDNDHDLDLYVVSGGNEFALGSPYYKDRLYLNDGKGNFSPGHDRITSIASSGSCVAVGDYDQDGDLDLFIGGRLKPQHYPEPGESLILENNGGKFTDVTERVAPGLKNSGMVTASLWTDFNNDHLIDLIIVGEWMPVMIFENRDGQLVLQKNAVENSAGWWNSINAADFDQDGDMDYILGNLGLNSRYKASPAEPVTIFTGDLNGDGTNDPVISHFIEGINRPAHPREDLLLQVNSLKKTYPSYASYAEARVEDLLGKDSDTRSLRCQTFSSSYLENKGSGGWELRPLPLEAQFAPVYGIVTGEFTGDEYNDAVLVGNSYAPDVLTGRYDAMTGLVLRGNGTGKFFPVKMQESGLVIDADAKGLAVLSGEGSRLLLATQNNDKVRALDAVKNNNTFFRAATNDAFAIVTLGNGKKVKHEFYYGNGYLSQSSRLINLPPDAISVMVYDFKGAGRTLTRGKEF